jgi:hypothetical protein
LVVSAVSSNNRKASIVVVDDSFDDDDDEEIEIGRWQQAAASRDASASVYEPVDTFFSDPFSLITSLTNFFFEIILLFVFR